MSTCATPSSGGSGAAHSRAYSPGSLARSAAAPDSASQCSQQWRRTATDGSAGVTASTFAAARVTAAVGVAGSVSAADRKESVLAGGAGCDARPTSAEAASGAPKGTMRPLLEAALRSLRRPERRPPSSQFAASANGDGGGATEACEGVVVAAPHALATDHAAGEAGGRRAGDGVGGVGRSLRKVHGATGLSRTEPASSAAGGVVMASRIRLAPRAADGV